LKWNHSCGRVRHYIFSPNTMPLNMILKRLFLLMAFVGLTACSGLKNENNPPDPPDQETSCTVDSDCQLPPEYMDQASCSFAAMCRKGSCYAACPLPQPDLELGKSAMCSADEDCDCSELESDECVCLRGTCLSLGVL